MQKTQSICHNCLFIFLAFLLLCLSACIPVSTPRSTHITDPALPLLRVGVTTTAPPLIFSKNETITGLEADFARQFAQSIGKSAKFIKVDWSDQISALENNKIDIIMSGMTITQSREYRISFANPYIRSGQILLVRLKEKGQFSTGIYSLMNSNYVIGTVKNTTGDIFITSTLNHVKVKNFKKSQDAVDALIDGDIDAFVYDAPMVCYYAAINENAILTPILNLATEEYLAWGIRKEDTLLLNQANTFLQSLKDNQQLQQVIRKWIPYM